MTPPAWMSWSSGKDSAFALEVARVEQRVDVQGMIVTVNADADRVAMHAVRRTLLEAQAERLGLSSEFSGRAFDETLLADLPDHVDPCGERGEFHTFVWDGPGFSSPIDIEIGETVCRDGFVFRDILAAS